MAPRAFVDSRLVTGERVKLEGDSFRHLCKVLRARTGDRVTLFNGNGGEFSAVLETVERRTATARIGEHSRDDRKPELEWHLIQAISKGDRMDYTLQKSTELGMASVIPVLTSRSVVNLDEERAAKRRAHWQGVVRSACEQCGLNRVPDVMPVAGLGDGLAAAPSGTRLLLDPRADESISDVGATAPVILLIGPEGGLDESEMEQARAAGFRGVRMGPRTLRTETAAIVAAAILLDRSRDFD